MPRVSTSTESEIIRTLRAINRLQTRARKLTRQIKLTRADLRIERRNLRALQGHLEARRPDVAPMRLYGGAVGIAAGKVEHE